MSTNNKMALFLVSLWLIGGISFSTYIWTITGGHLGASIAACILGFSFLRKLFAEKM